MKGSPVYIEDVFAKRDDAINCARKTYETWHRDPAKIVANGRDCLLQAIK